MQKSHPKIQFSSINGAQHMQASPDNLLSNDDNNMDFGLNRNYYVRQTKINESGFGYSERYVEKPSANYQTINAENIHS